MSDPAMSQVKARDGPAWAPRIIKAEVHIFDSRVRKYVGKNMRNIVLSGKLYPDRGTLTQGGSVQLVENKWVMFVGTPAR
jgi:phage protein U